MSKLKKFLNNPLMLFFSLGHREWLNWMSDELYLKIGYWIKFKKKLNLDNPQTYNEKLQWLKLYDRNPLYTQLVDKYEVKKIVAEKIGAEYIIPTLGVWEHFDEIDFDKLPNQFVLKCTHDSGGLIVVKDKSKLDKKAARKKIEYCLKHSFFWGMREWPYKDVKPRIIAEQYMEDTQTKELSDYKFFCFNGSPKTILVCKDRYSKTGLTEDFFSVNWEHLNIKRPTHPNAAFQIGKPSKLKLMLDLAEKLAENIPFSRIDFYEVNGNAYFGEITFYPASGLSAFVPEEWDYTFGSWIKLPNNTK